MSEHRTLTAEEWEAEGKRRFGDDKLKWRFVCPSCGHAAAAEDWKSVGASNGEVAFSCVGRHMPDTDKNTFSKKHGPCNYAGGGLFRLNPVTVVFPDGAAHTVFEFDDSASLHVSKAKP